MKKSVIGLCMLAIILISCSTQKGIKGIKSIINKAAEANFEITETNYGTTIFRLSQPNDKGFKTNDKLKNSIDKYLNILPFETELKKMSYSGKLCDRYDWETPEIKVHLYIEYDTDTVNFEVDVTLK